MTLTRKDQRLYRRYNPLSRRLSSIFMLIVVFPTLTGLDVVAYDAVNDLNAKRAQEKYSHNQLCEIAPQYLQGNLLPRLRTLAQKVRESKGETSPGGDNDLQSQINVLSDDLKRIKLALLDNFSKHDKLSDSEVPQGGIEGAVPSGDSNKSKIKNPSVSAALRENIHKSKIQNLKSKIITTVNRLQTYCRDLSNTDKDKRNQAAVKILKLTDPQDNARQFKLPTANPLKSNTNSATPQLNFLPSKNPPPPNNLLYRRGAETQRKNLEQGLFCTQCKKNDNTSAPQRLSARSKNDSHSRSNNSKSKISNLKSKMKDTETILDLSRIPLPQTQLAAASDVLTPFLTEVSDPNATGSPSASDIAFSPPQTDTNDTVAQLVDKLKTPVKIFEYFRNNFVYEPYFGAVKGTVKTLNEMAGNDVDLASALISVYREAGIPCRYVYGTIQLTVEQAASWLGVNPSQVNELLSENHIPYKNLGTPGVGELLIDHVWVKAYIDYFPYRGATEVIQPADENLEKRGDTWVEIDPSFKQHTFSQRRDIEAELGIQSENFLTNIRSQTSRDLIPNNPGIANHSNGEVSDDNVTLLPQAFILNEVIGLANPLAKFLTQNQLTTTTVFRQRFVSEEIYGLLPVTDFYKIHARGLAFSTFPTPLTTTVHLSIKNVAGEEVLSYDSNLAELLTRSLSLSYIPATADDRALVDAWSNTPGESVSAYAVDVIPQLSLGETIVATGSVADTLGSAHTLKWTIHPAGSESAYFSIPEAASRIEAEDSINAGSLNTFVFDAGKVTDTEITTLINQIAVLSDSEVPQGGIGGDVPIGDVPPSTIHHQLTTLLRAVGLNYFYQADRFAEITAGVLDLYAQRTPSLIRISYSLEVDELFGLPYTATAKTIKTAVIHDTFALTPISSTDTNVGGAVPSGDPHIGGAPQRRSLFTHINALTSSALGSNSLQQFFFENALSTARLFQVASETNNPVYTLKIETDDSGNPVSSADTNIFADLDLTISPATQQLIVAMLNRGWNITFTRDPVNHGGLTRDPMFAVDPMTGDSGFFLFAPGYEADLIGGSELQFSEPPITFKQLLTPTASDPLPLSLVANATEWLYALPDATTNAGIAFLPAITHIKNFLSKTNVGGAVPSGDSVNFFPPNNVGGAVPSGDSQLSLSSLKTVAASIALIGRIDEISQQPGIVDLTTEPDFISPNNDGVQDHFIVNAITTRTASWNIRFANNLGDHVRKLTAVHNEPPNINNQSRIHIQWDGTDETGVLLPDGAYDYVITAQGIGGTTYSGSMMIDATAPTASLEVETKSVADDTILTFNGSVDDANFSQYTLVIKKADTGEIVLTPFSNNLPVINGRFGGLSTHELENGSYIVELTVEDQAGNTTTVQSQPLTIENRELDRTPPEISVVSPLTDPDVGVLNGLVPVSVSAFDESGIAKIEVVVDSLVVDRNVDLTTLDTEIDLGNLADGVHIFKVAVTDHNGNQAVTEESKFLTSTSAPDSQKPKLIVTLPDTTQALAPSVPLTANAEDNDRLQAITVRVDGQAIAQEIISGTAPLGSLTSNLDPSIFTDGSHTLAVQTTDISGNTDEKILVIPVASDSDPPQLALETSVDSDSTTHEGDVDVRVSASDDQIIRQILLYLDGALIDSVTAPDPHPHTALATLQSQILAVDLLDGAHEFVAKAVDAAGNISSTVPINFTSANPIANFNVTPSLVRPNLPTGTQVTVTATLQAETNWTLQFTGPSPIADITGMNRIINEVVNVANFVDGEYTVKLVAEGVLEQPTADFVVDLITGPTIARITNVSTNQLISDGLFHLRGAADDPDSTDDVSYRITLHDINSGALVRNVTPGPLNDQGFRESRVPATGSLGMVDFTMVRNGIYDLRLTVKGGTDTKTRQVRIILSSDLKVGQFSFSQQDMIIPVNGQPLSVIRTYNTLNPKVGDFGHSWTWSITDVELELDEERDSIRDLDDQVFSQRVGGSRNVTLTLPDGRRTTFRFQLERAGRFKHRAKWIAPPGVHATLESLGSNELVTLFGGLQYWQAAGPQTPLEAYDFPGFILTMEDGSEYLIEREYTGDHFILDDFGASYFVETYGEAELRQITQRSGDRIEFNTDRIDHFDATGANTKSIVFQRNAQGRISAIHDPIGLDANGQPIRPAAYTYEYDGNGNLTKVNQLIDRSVSSSPVYETTTFIYGDPNFPHFITEIQDPRGVTPMRNEYDDSGRLIGVVDAFGNRIELDHDIATNTETIYDREGNATIHVYDNRGNVVSTTDSLGHTTKRTYDQDNNETSVTDPLGNTTRFTYNVKGNRTSVTDPLGNTTRFTYDNFGNQLSVTDPLGHTTTNRYDNKGNIKATTNALGQSTRTTYDARGNLSSIADVLGNVIATFAYDTSGNLTEATDVFGFTRSFTYDANGNQTSTSYEWINPNNGSDMRTVATQTVYNAAGQVIRTVDPENNTSTTLYNAIGAPIETIDKLGNTMRTTYNARGNIIETEFPDGTITRTVYDKNGRAAITTDRYLPGSPTPVNGNRTIYDAAGRVVRSERLGDVVVDILSDGNGGLTSKFVLADRIISSTSSIYDAAGRVIESFNADGEVTRFEYDAVDRQTAVIDTLGNRTEFEYDAAGRQVLVRDALGRETEFEYDALGRRTKTIFLPTNVLSDSSVPQGGMGGGVLAGDFSTTHITTYNELGQRIAETDQNGNTREFEYDLLGRLTAVILPEVEDPENEDTLTHPRYEYDYDSYGRLTTIRDPKGRETHFTYDEFGRQLTRTLPMGQTECQSYNALGQLQFKADFKGQVTEFRYDHLGRVSEKRLYPNVGDNNNVGGGVPTGEPCDPCSSADFLVCAGPTPDAVYTFTYDDFGRQSQIEERGGGTSSLTTFGYDPDGRLSFVASPEGTIYYEYDPVTGRKDRTFTANSDILYDYDELGRLAAVTVLKQNGIVLTDPQVTTYDYNEVGSQSAIHYPNNTHTEYEYNTLNQLTKLTHKALGESSVPQGGMGGASSPRLLSSYQYQLAPNGSRTAVTETRLEPDDTYSTTGITYTYDTLNRLIQEASGSDLPEANFNTIYTYDLVGNRLQKATNKINPSTLNPETETFSYTYNPNDQLLEEVLSVSEVPQGGIGGAGVASGPSPSGRLSPRSIDYTYDLNGSLTSKIITPDPSALSLQPSAYSYTYNLENRLSSAKITRTETINTTDHDVAITVNYTYNQSGIRVGARTSTTIDNGPATTQDTHYLLDTNNPTGYTQILEEYDTAGPPTPTVSYTIGTDIISQSTTDNGQRTTDHGQLTTDYFHYDAHGSTRLLTNATGTITDHYNYDAYGKMISVGPQPTGSVQWSVVSGQLSTALLYSGEQFDVDLQQQYLRARYYDQSNGRFNRLDPFSGDIFSPLSLHKYAYTHNDPVNGLDPSGRITLVETMTVVDIALFQVAIEAESAASILNFARGRFGSTKAVDLLVKSLTVGLAVGSLLGLVSMVRSLARLPRSIARFSGRFPGIIYSSLKPVLKSPNLKAFRFKGYALGKFKAKFKSLWNAIEGLNLEADDPVFWGNAFENSKNATDAAGWATTNGKKTITQIAGVDSWLQKLSNAKLPKWQERLLFAKLSAKYARQAKGTVRVFATNAWDKSIWRLIEKPLLLKNKNVTSIIEVAPAP